MWRFYWRLVCVIRVALVQVSSLILYEVNCNVFICSTTYNQQYMFLESVSELFQLVSAVDWLLIVVEEQ